MSLADPNVEPQPPRGHVRIVYLGPVAPHWEVVSDFGDRNVIDDFRSRVMARLMLLPPHDPQFRRNRERARIERAERHRGAPDERTEAGGIAMPSCSSRWRPR